MTMNVQVVKSDSNGGEFFVYTDGSLAGVYATTDKVGEVLGEEIAMRLSRLTEEEEDEG